jgi:hypothetical protein
VNIPMFEDHFHTLICVTKTKKSTFLLLQILFNQNTIFVFFLNLQVHKN